MKKEIIPENYIPKLDIVETEKAIKLTKDTFEKFLSEELNLIRVSAPRMLKTGNGVQDDLAGTQTPVSFNVKHVNEPIEVPHSLAKWKRMALKRYGFKAGAGLYTDMDAIRKDEDVSPIHSVYVDQWDWEKVITSEQRTIDYLESTVKSIYKVLLETESVVEKEFPVLVSRLPKEIYFIHSEELEEKYPDLSPKERERKITKEYGAVFVIGIGHPLKSGEPHDIRAADYDDWSTEGKNGMKGLNGDIIIWDNVRKDALEISSMGIRVNHESMENQLDHMGLSHKKELKFHKGVIEKKLPLCIGGGVGQSRICMALLQKAHIGEVQSSVWSSDVENECEKRGVKLL